MRLARDQKDANDRFYAIVWPHAATVLRTAHFLVRDFAEAEDIAQETMIKAFKSLSQFADGTDVRAWLMTILRNTRIDHIRAASSHSANVSLDALGVELGAEAEAGDADDDPAWSKPDELLQGFGDQHVIDALQELPEEIRWTLLLVDVHGMTHEDASKVLDVPVGTVKSRTFRGRGMLRKTLLLTAKDLRLVE